MSEDVAKIVTALQGGGNAALIVAVYFIYQAADRLSRIEKALEEYMRKEQNK
jgi:hypothetical protein